MVWKTLVICTLHAWLDPFVYFLAILEAIWGRCICIMRSSADFKINKSTYLKLNMHGIELKTERLFTIGITATIGTCFQFDVMRDVYLIFQHLECWQYYASSVKLFVHQSLISISFVAFWTDLGYEGIIDAQIFFRFLHHIIEFGKLCGKNSRRITT